MIDGEKRKQPSIFKLKKQYKRLFLITIHGYDIIFRLLTWGEVKAMHRIMHYGTAFTERIIDDVFNECIIESNIEDPDLTPAGLIPTIVNLIITLSSYQDANEFMRLLDNTRTEFDRLNAHIELLICYALKCSPSDLDELSLEDILYYLALSERIVGEQLPSIPITLEDPTKDKKKKKKKDLPPGVIDFKAENKMMSDV